MNLNVLKYFPLMPEQASDEAMSYDHLYWFISGLALFFGVIVVIMTIWLAIKYRRGSTADRRNPIDHHKGFEALIVSSTMILAMFTFWWSMNEYVRYRTMPTKAKEIFVIGKQWMWHLQHMNGIRENNELHVPVDTPIKFTMISQDVLHAFYLPEFRAQYHVVPGRYTELYIKPNKTGRFRILCAMHCGTQHSEMVGWIYVMSKKEFAAWEANGGNKYLPIPTTMAEAGKRVWDTKGCNNCHSGADTFRGPSLAGIYGTTRQLDDGTAVADTSYLRDSILTPWRRLTKGYEATMPAYQGQMTEEDVLNLIEYIKTGTNTAEPGKLSPYSVPSPGGTRFGPTRVKSATDLSNENDSAPMTQAEQGAERR
ncbi:MAG: c-type cytochrome [Armatimonadetes bacterium]|nr:c-type cytochrome [Armatimonadota bacterium]